MSNAAGISSDLLMKSLSDDAKVVLGALFGRLGIPGQSQLTYQMVRSRPTVRMQQALDELVKSGALTRNPFNASGGVTYTVQINCTDFAKWFGRNMGKGKWKTDEPIVKEEAASQ
ncbi:MAG TPA: hypothetical protein VKW08_07950 [Xanthobacteraceae bacterium]|nr:hypothetical protein [Xanthobacteraceae bacterium]